MKTTTKKRALVSSVAMLLVAMLALGTATFAWFTNNKTVTADGMSVKAAAAKGLQITKNNGTTWAPSVTFSTAAATLTPVSAPYTSANGAAYGHFSSYFAPSEVGGAEGGVWTANDSNNVYKNWSSKTTTTINKPSTATGENAEAISTATGTQDFIAYEVGVKSTGDPIPGVTMKVKYENDTTTQGKSAEYIRVAVLQQAATEVNYATDTILKVIGNDTYTVTGVGGSTSTEHDKVITAIDNETKLPSNSAVQKLEANDSTVTLTSDITSGGTYFTILVWFEGQDTQCVDANQQVKGNISIEFSYA